MLMYGETKITLQTTIMRLESKMIKFIDLYKTNNYFRAEIDGGIKIVLDKGWYLEDEENEIFARNFAKFCGTKLALDIITNELKRIKNAFR